MNFQSVPIEFSMFFFYRVPIKLSRQNFENVFKCCLSLFPLLFQSIKRLQKEYSHFWSGFEFNVLCDCKAKPFCDRRGGDRLGTGAAAGGRRDRRGARRAPLAADTGRWRAGTAGRRSA